MLSFHSNLYNIRGGSRHFNKRGGGDKNYKHGEMKNDTDEIGNILLKQSII
jgi:hypothetical protein